MNTPAANVGRKSRRRLPPNERPTFWRKALSLFRPTWFHVKEALAV